MFTVPFLLRCLEPKSRALSLSQEYHINRHGTPVHLLEEHRRSKRRLLMANKDKNRAYAEKLAYDIGFSLIHDCAKHGYFAYHERNARSIPMQVILDVPELYEVAKAMRYAEIPPTIDQDNTRGFEASKNGMLMRKRYLTHGTPYRAYNREFINRVYHDVKSNLYSLEVDGGYYGAFATEMAALRVAKELSKKQPGYVDSKKLSVYPNPTSGKLDVTKCMSPTERVTITQEKYIRLRNSERVGWLGPYGHMNEAIAMKYAIMASGTWVPYFDIALKEKPFA